MMGFIDAGAGDHRLSVMVKRSAATALMNGRPPQKVTPAWQVSVQPDTPK
jgi:hypothetical protein